MSQEFLPLCDVLFNIISLVSYFCDVVFDLLSIYTLFVEEQFVWFALALTFVATSLAFSQVCSLRWYWVNRGTNGSDQQCHWAALALLHACQGGILWRYFRLFLPVDVRHVKHEVRDLCMLRLVHAFCQAAPMLLLQFYLIWLRPKASDVTDLNVVSTALSLFSVCWALASFNKNARRHNVHRLVLTWLGVICQFLWRLGTVTSRALALTAYASLYSYWVFLVMGLHWVTMLLWLITPRNIFHGEKMPPLKKFIFSGLIAFCYVFCYINLQEVNVRSKMVAFYVTMLLENSLLIAVWLAGVRDVTWYQHPVTALVFISFTMGIVFMLLYYQHFHVKRLSYQYNMSTPVRQYYSTCTACQLGECNDKSHRVPYYTNEFSASEQSTLEGNVGRSKRNNNKSELRYLTQSSFQNPDAVHVAGVFNCRFNPGVKRKKKKPTSFVPPPMSHFGFQVPGKVPFWKRPLPSQTLTSDHEGSIGSRVNIQQKLREKKQQQIAELRQIEEEIRAGKLQQRPGDISGDSGTLRQPIPSIKRNPWLRSRQAHRTPCPPYGIDDNPSIQTTGVSAVRKPRSQTPEVLLAPQYLDDTRAYCEYQREAKWKYGNNYHLPSDDVSGSSHSQRRSAKRRPHKKPTSPAEELDVDDRESAMYKSYRISSDVDSQISLPRSLTLPREFKYRRPKSRKSIRMDQFVPSTNSSDGDVDSVDEMNANDQVNCQFPPQPNQLYHHHQMQYSHHSHHQSPLTLAMDPPCPPHQVRQSPAYPRIWGHVNTHETQL